MDLKNHIRRPWCSDDTPMTPQRIIELATRKGEFTVHRYLYRAENLRRACQKMVGEGLLKRAGQDGEFLVFKLPAAAE